MTANSHSLSRSLLLLSLLLLGGCATGGQPLSAARDLDPLERSNRAVFAFNQRIDRVLFKPAAEIYKEQLPPALRSGISNFFRNLAEPTTVLNDILQGKGRQTINDGARFAINTTLGVFGLFDIAGSLGLVHHQEDYGQTLARWGVPAGPYLVLPVFGPSNIRDAAGKLPINYTHKPVAGVHRRGDGKARISNKATLRRVLRYSKSTINISCDSLVEVDRAIDRDFDTVVTLPEDANDAGKVTLTPKGRKVLHCPATWGEVSCGGGVGKNGVYKKPCGGGIPLCAIKGRKFAIGFPAHGSGKKRLTFRILNNLQ